MSRRTDAPSRPALSRDAIVAVALGIVDEEGTAAVSMRRVADHFGTGPASLYAHVPSREELLLLVLDAVIGELLPAPVTNPKRWRQQLLDLLTGMRRVLSEHGDIAFMAMGRIPVHENMLTLSEAMIALLLESGMGAQDVALAADLIPLYVVAVAYEEGLEGVGGRKNGEEYHQEVAERWSQLSPQRFPAIHSVMPDLFTAGDADERFRFGLEVLLDGLVSRARTPVKRTARPTSRR